MNGKKLISTTMQINEEQYINLDGYILYHIDRFYGTDADGNRGESRTIIDDVVDVAAYDDDGDDIKLQQYQLDNACKVLGDKFLEG